MIFLIISIVSLLLLFSFFFIDSYTSSKEDINNLDIWPELVREEGDQKYF